MKSTALSVLAGLVVLLGVCTAAQATTAVTVGSDAACDYPDISQAVANAPNTDFLFIQLARNVSITAPQLLLSGRLVQVIGGYDTCSDTTASGRTAIDASAYAGSTLVMRAGYDGPPYHTIFLNNLEITHGHGSAAAKGGALTIDGPFSVLLNNTYLHDNSSAWGGGAIYIVGQSGTSTGTEFPHVQLYRSIVSNNTAENGGGIACTGQASLLSDESRIGDNQASDAGGGVSSTGCYMTFGAHGPLQGVVGNRTTSSNGKGGGIYADGGQVNVAARPEDPSEIAFNTADSGGGIYLQAASLHTYDGSILSNTATSRGGGIYAIDSNVTMERFRAGADCHAELRCSQLSHNRVTGGSGTASGGALYASGGRTHISGTFIEDNSTAAGAGQAIYVTNAPGSKEGQIQDGLLMYGDVVTGNGSGSSFMGTPAASIVTMQDSSGRIGYTTFAGNAAVPQVVHTPVAGSTFYDIDIFGSIFANSSGLDSDPNGNGPTAAGDCNDLSESSSAFAQASTRSVHNGAVFVNAAGNDYRLAATSGDIDYCDTGLPDISADGGPRPYDDPGRTALYGDYDLGGLERHPDDLIFRDDFE